MSFAANIKLSLFIWLQYEILTLLKIAPSIKLIMYVTQKQFLKNMYIQCIRRS